ncbi:MAG: class I SAM-dependent methyltransferase [Candidatus Thermoplasmatota archaeon]|nr:class I SAM-dependent methyltransferase [Candidatus Thermoplasmatota archaeon]
MTKIEPFEKYSKEYDKWFIRNHDVYQTELDAIKNLIPINKEGVEIGVGSGRFALPLGIKIGVEPSRKMADMARSKGIQIYESVAEQLPFQDKKFDFTLMVTTICFVDDILKSFQEAYRILKNDGFIIVGFVDKNSELGRRYQLKSEESKFYKYATFHSSEEVIALLKKANFIISDIKQTVYSNKKVNEISLVKNGYGKGNFVVIKALKIDK